MNTTDVEKELNYLELAAHGYSLKGNISEAIDMCVELNKTKTIEDRNHFCVEK